MARLSGGWSDTAASRGSRRPARILVRLYAASRLHTNFFQPSFKLKDKRREGAKVIKRYHATVST